MVKNAKNEVDRLKPDVNPLKDEVKPSKDVVEQDSPKPVTNSITDDNLKTIREIMGFGENVKKDNLEAKLKEWVDKVKLKELIGELFK